jgi:hypothetical protein
VKKEKLQVTQQRYKGSLQTIRNNYTPANLINLEEVDELLDTYTSPRLNHEGTENLNRMITTNKIGSVAKFSPQRRTGQLHF